MTILSGADDDKVSESAVKVLLGNAPAIPCPAKNRAESEADRVLMMGELVDKFGYIDRLDKQAKHGQRSHIGNRIWLGIPTRNTSAPSFHRHLDWSRQRADVSGLRQEEALAQLLWQAWSNYRRSAENPSRRQARKWLSVACVG